MGIKSEIYEKMIGKLAADPTMEDLALASATLRNLKETDNAEEDIYSIGTQGSLGFGVGAIRDWQLPSGYTKLSGHDDVTSDNYGNVYDPNGSHMVCIPKHYYKYDGNTLYISANQAAGFVLDRAFIDGGIEKDYVLVDKFGCGNVGGKFVSKQGIDPCSTNSAHNPISALSNAPADTYGGLYKAAKTRGSKHFLTSVFIYAMLARLAKAHGQSSATPVSCAFIDVNPKMPKGNLNNALADVNDPSVTFSSSGYSNCALTGSGRPFAKTTHNGQASGVADLTGNMWEVGSGFTLLNATPTINDFKILKESVSLSAILDDSTTAGTGAYDPNLYDALDVTNSMLVDATTTGVWEYLGSGANTVFAMSTDRGSAAYRQTALGIPQNTGVDGVGTTEFGNDGIYRYLRNELAVLCGGYWGYTSHAGVFAMTLNYNRTNSSGGVGGRASVFV